MTLLQTILTESYNDIAIILAQVDPKMIAEKLAQKQQDQFTTKMILKIGIPIGLGIIYLIINSMTKKKKTESGENVSENMKLCPFCGEEILADAKKCGHCKKEFNKMPNTSRNEQTNNNQKRENIEDKVIKKVKQCPYCGEEILAAAKKCKHCGEWLNH
jgi:ribosomal protein S27AE